MTTMDKFVANRLINGKTSGKLDINLNQFHVGENGKYVTTTDNGVKPPYRGHVIDQTIRASRSPEHVQPSTSNNNTPKTRTFKKVVDKHFNKDKLFHLVHTLLRSIEDERKAGDDLIQSFETARNIKIPLLEELKHQHARPRRRRKRNDIPLAERIHINRKMNIENDHKEEICEKAEVTGKLEIEASEVTHKDKEEIKCNNEDNSDSEDESFSHGQHERQGDSKSLHGIETECNNDVYVVKPRSKSVPAGEMEKKLIVEQLNMETNRPELDKQVLESVLTNNDSKSEAESKKEEIEDSEVEEEDEQLSQEESDINKETDMSNKIVVNIEVELDTESEHDEEEFNKQDVIGVSDDDEHDGKYDSDSGSDEHVDCHDNGDTDSEHSEDEGIEFRNVNEPNVYVSTMEYNRKPLTKTQPTLDPISEAEHSAESFKSLYGRKSSSSIIEIEPLGRATRSQRVHRLQKQQHVEQENEEIYNGYIGKKRHTSMNKRTAEVTSVYKVKGNKSSKHRTEPLNALSQKTINSSSTKHNANRPTSQKGNKTSKHNLISIDLLNLYDENEDLQQVNKSELSDRKTKRQFSKHSKSSDIRTTSVLEPRKTKRSKRRYKHDNRPLPPQILSPRQPKTCLSVKQLSEISSNKGVTTTSGVHLDSYRYYENEKAKTRYSKPSCILWENIDVTEHTYRSEDTNSPKRDVTFHEPKSRNTVTGNSKISKSWNEMPLNEAIKSIKGATEVPKLLNLREETPRSERVQKIYNDLNHDRRDTGYIECKYLDFSPRRASHQPVF